MHGQNWSGSLRAETDFIVISFQVVGLCTHNKTRYGLMMRAKAQETTGYATKRPESSAVLISRTLFYGHTIFPEVETAYDHRVINEIISYG